MNYSMSSSQTHNSSKTYSYRDLANVPLSHIDSSDFNCHDEVPPQSLQEHKLPKRLASMLSDSGEYVIAPVVYHWRSSDSSNLACVELCLFPIVISNFQHFLNIPVISRNNISSFVDLAEIITWMPHGRSWKVLDRDRFMWATVSFRLIFFPAIWSLFTSGAISFWNPIT